MSHSPERDLVTAFAALGLSPSEITFLRDMDRLASERGERLINDLSNVILDSEISRPAQVSARIAVLSNLESCITAHIFEVLASLKRRKRFVDLSPADRRSIVDEYLAGRAHSIKTMVEKL